MFKLVKIVNRRSIVGLNRAVLPAFIHSGSVNYDNNKGRRVRMVVQKDGTTAKSERMKIDPKEVNFQQKYPEVQRYKSARPITIEDRMGHKQIDKRIQDLNKEGQEKFNQKKFNDEKLNQDKINQQNFNQDTINQEKINQDEINQDQIKSKTNPDQINQDKLKLNQEKLKEEKLDFLFDEPPKEDQKSHNLGEIKLEPTVHKTIPKLQATPKLEPPPPKLEEIVPNESAIRAVQNRARGGNIISTVTQTDSRKNDDGDEREKIERENSWQTMRFTFVLFGISFTGIGVFLIMELGKPKIAEDGKEVEDEFSNMPILEQYVYRTAHQLDYYRKLINEPSRDKLLPDELKYPYHQPPYTLVLELKDVLVHPDWTYNTGWRFKKRPGIDQFLETLNGIYEIVIYTAELGMTVFPILEALDPNNLITYKLVRDATNFVDGKHVKDLDKLNRPLRKVVLVDWNAESITNNRDNALLIPRWDGDDNDTALLDLANLLRVIAISEIQDVREVLRFYKEYENPLAAFRDRQRELERTMYSN